MFLLGLLTLVVATVPLAGGRLGRISEIRFARAWAGASALALQYLTLRVFPHGSPALHAAAHLASYGLLFYFLAANLRVPGLLLLAIGGALNALAIAANDGVMPARPAALAAAGIVQAPGRFVNSGAVAHPKLWFLGDVFAVPAGWPMSNVFSVGDILLVVGALVLLHYQAGSRLAPALRSAGARIFHAAERLEVLRDHRGFRRLFLAQGISGIGDWIFTPAVFVAVVHGHGRASELALLLVFQVGPGMVVGLVGGPFIDRFSRKRLMIGTDALRALAVASLLVGGGTPSLPHVYAVALVLGVGNALFQPAFLAAMPNFVPQPLLTSANALVGFTSSLAVMAGFPLGGWIVQEFGIRWGFAANALSFAFCGALVAGTSFPTGVRVATKSLVTDLADGFRYVRGNRTVRSVIVVVGLITLAAGAKSPLESLFALDTLNAGTMGLGLLGAVWGAGMILGAIFATRLDRRTGHARMLTYSVGLVAVVVILASLSPVLAPVAVLWVFGGMGNTTGTVAYETLLQERTEDAVRGRVMAALEASVQAGLLIGVGLAAASDTLFRHDDVARSGLAMAGGLFGLAALASWWLVQRPAEAPWEVRDLEVLPVGEAYALLRITAEGPEAAAAPVLVLHDGGRPRRLPALHGGVTLPCGRRRYGYGVPRSALPAAGGALALDTGGGRPIELSLP